MLASAYNSVQACIDKLIGAPSKLHAARIDLAPMVKADRTDNNRGVDDIHSILSYCGGQIL